MSNPRLNRLFKWLKRPEVFLTFVALVPLAVELIRSLQMRTPSMGDFANVEIRSRDVFSFHHFPLVGTASSATNTLGLEVNHPGPMLFLYLAPFVEIIDGARGLQAGVVILNGGTLVACTYVGYRMLGRFGAMTAMLMSSTLVWVLGSDLISSTWNPYVLVLPCLLMLMLAWGVASGHAWMLPWLLLVGSFCVQTHLGYVYLVSGVCLVSVVGLIIVQRKSLTVPNGCRHRNSWLIGVAVMLACWALPLWDQVAGAGNLGRLVESLGSDVPKLGFDLATKIVAGVIALPPWWSRSALSDAIPPVNYSSQRTLFGDEGLTTPVSAIIGLILLTSVLVAVVFRSWRRKDRILFTAGSLSLALIPLALIAVASSLPTMFFAVAAYNYLWLWSIGAFVTFVLVVFAAKMLASEEKSRHFVILMGGLVAVTALAAVPVYKHSVHTGMSNHYSAEIAAVEQILDQLNLFRPAGTVLVDTTNEPFNSPFHTAAMAYLRRRGIDFNVTKSKSLTHLQMGMGRQSDGTESAVLKIYVGRLALKKYPASQVVASTNPLSAEELADFKQLEKDLVDAMRNGQVALKANIRQDNPSLAAGFDEMVQAPERAVLGGRLLNFYRYQVLALTDESQVQLERLKDLTNQIQDGAVVVVVEPLSKSD